MIYAFVVYLWASFCFILVDLTFENKMTLVDVGACFLWPIYPFIYASGFVYGFIEGAKGKDKPK